jgi:hypothetical protein
VTVEQILGEARATVARGGEPDWKSFRDRIRRAEPDERALREALARLERIGAVHRARKAQACVESTQAPPEAPRRRALLRTRPTLTGDLEVRRERAGDALVLAWRAEPGVDRWEVRVAERSGSRGDYVLLEERELPGTATNLELPGADAPLRVHLLGRSRAGRLVRRAIASGLAPDSWDERWQRRPS